MPARQLIEPRPELGAERVGSSPELRLGDRVENDAGGGAGDRVAAERPAEPARAGRVHDLGPAVTAAKGRPPPSDFPETSRSGATPLCSTAHIRPVRPYAPLHLVCDEENPVRVAEPAQPPQVVARHRDEAALALHGLEHDARDRLRLDVALEEVLERCDRGISVDAAVRIRSCGAVDLPGKSPNPAL